MATLPFLSDIGQTMHWYTQSQLADMVAVSESTPGPLGINMATYVGFRVGGVLGAIVSTLSEVLPSVIIITLIAMALSIWNSITFINWKAVAFGVVIFTMTNRVPKVKKLHPIIFIAIAAVVGIVVKF